MFDIFCSGLLLSTFHWFTSSGPLQQNLLTSWPKTRHPKHLHQTRIFQQPFTPKPFCTGHYIPYITCFFPQPEKPKSRVPSLPKKLATLLFTGLPLLGLSAAKLTQFIPFDLAPPSLASSHAISAAPARPSLVHVPFIRIIPFDLALPSLASSNAISAAPARPSLVHVPSTRIIPFAFYTRLLYARHLLHQTPFTPGTFYAKHLSHQTPFTPDTFYTRHLFTRHLSHQTPFTPDNFYTWHLFH